MESVEAEVRDIKLTDEAKETIKRILIHILNPLHNTDREEIIIHLCNEMDVYPDDPLY